jgi:hypothetical protein
VTEQQLTLDIAPLSTEPIPADLTIQERFEAFHEANPWVLDRLAHMTRDWLARGHQRVGIGMLFEVLRYDYSVATHGDDFKLNNSLRSRYARRLIEDHPEWQDAFETRRLRAA